MQDNKKLIHYLKSQLVSNPTDTKLLLHLGVLLLNSDNIDEAISILRKAYDISPNSFDITFHLANCYLKRRDFVAAKDLFFQSLNLNPQDIDSYINIAICLRYLNQHKEAIKYLEKGLLINPHDPDLYLNRGVLYRELLMLDDAIRDYKKVIQINPKDYYGYYNLSLVYLLKGDYKRGFALYQSRWKTDDFLKLTKPKKQWNGIIDNFVLLLRTEQGFGDTIQFIRYSKYFAEKGITVKVKCQPQLVELLRNNCGIKEIHYDENELGNYDFDTYLLDVPYLLKTDLNSIPVDIPYIFARDSKIEGFKSLTSKSKKYKIGICFSGSKTNTRAINRSINVEELIALLKINRNISYYSLQIADSLGDLLKLSDDIRPTNLSQYLRDFSDTAGLIYHMDSVITIDSSIAHLAGAMGKETFLILNYSSDWRWLIDIEYSPWYPTIKILRQDKPFDWSNVIARLIKIVKELESKD
ncbi:MAG TPA: glycosyltransferase family protein [Nitrospirae bacterium]|nr:glycosyltransferase family protein [Nitrospirota bacterium]